MAGKKRERDLPGKPSKKRAKSVGKAAPTGTEAKAQGPKTFPAESVTPAPTDSGQDRGEPPQAGSGAARPVRAAEAASPKEPSLRDDGLHVIGIGCSAGGLEALHAFFSHMPPDNGMAFVVISHLSPGHVSVMPEILRKFTRMTVLQIEPGMRLRPNTVYVTPPGSDVAVMAGTLKLLKPQEPRGLRLPIDHFLHSLAQDRGDKAVAIILSGTGSDGASGVREIKAALGLVIVQDPASAMYDGMPRSTLASGVVDFALPPEKIPEQLARFVRHVPVPEPESRKPGEKAPGAVEEILLIIRDQTKHDFSSYKKSTLVRRIERRMQVHQIGTLSKYAIFLRRNPNEARILIQELLIGVTGFFRDPKAFDVLKQKLLTRLKAKPSDYVFRVWVPGCSSGEEAYSVGIILRECLDALKKKVQVQMFGTDIDLKAIERARSGIYPAGISADVSAARLARFFIRKDGTYQIRQEIRQMVVFASQNVIKDPPFIKLDLLCCRNLLIYLEPEIQKKLIPLFHYALRPDGILFLGSAETIGEAHDLFSTLERKWRIFLRRGGAAGTRIDLPPLKFKDKIRPRLAPSEPGRQPGKFNIPDIAARLILEKFAPPSVVVNGNGDILYVHGRTGRFLEPSTGEGGFMNILRMSREGLRFELMTALRKAAENKQDVDLEDVSVRVNGSTVRARVSIKVLDDQYGGEELMLIVFQELATQSLRPQPSPGGRDDKKDNRVGQLKRELQYTKEYLQGTIEELETSNEELKSANEELQSTNEELQSTNEELETSQEELQSLNEEHITLNSELQSRVDELTQAENDMKNLLESTEIAMIFVDGNLRVTRFTSRATKIVNLIASDIGRPLADIVVNLCDESLIGDAQEVLRTLLPKEKEVQTRRGDCGHWYLMRMRPYRTIENVINGLVLTFVDIHAQKSGPQTGRTEAQAPDALCLAEDMIGIAAQPYLVLDRDLRVKAANQSFSRVFGMEKARYEGRPVFELGGGVWDVPRLKELLGNLVTSADAGFRDFELERDFAGLGRRKLHLGGRRLAGAEREDDIILVSIEDVTEPR